MAYQALARKWRPRQFSEVVGQEHVVVALTNALENDRVHHAFLFTGTRGVGKTTIARILAKSLNCEQGISATPCGSCVSCVSIDEGRFIDLIEVDAASRTKVDDTRELLDNVQYAPTFGQFKVYLIDEVHMLSGHSFNALLKTLEEPPSHVKFLLATTDPQKLPVTVLSRCLQFNLKVLHPEQISEQLKHILEQEQIQFEEAALHLLARSAYGSLRDGLSLLDQAIAYGGGTVTEQQARSMLGMIDQEYIKHLVQALVQQDAHMVMQSVAELSEAMPGFTSVLDELLLQLYHISLAQVAPEVLTAKQIDDTWIKEMARKLSKEDVQLYYQIGLTGKRDLPLAPDPRSGFEMLLLRMLAFRPADSDGQWGSVPTSQDDGVDLVANDTPSAARQAVKQACVADVSNWGELLATMKLPGLLGQLAVNSTPGALNNGTLTLMLDPKHQHLLNKEREAGLAQAISRHFGQDIRVQVEAVVADEATPAAEQARVAAERKQAAVEAIESDPYVQDIIERFDATVIPDSIRPRE
ncbi:MAG: DNA polymerase III subunit gamma/tau [Gammaproteobacteria bacterium]|nr:DNA polymerase III subunit gamma/tau [Gammaproteobacteria bacterium]